MFIHQQQCHIDMLFNNIIIATGQVRETDPSGPILGCRFSASVQQLLFLYVLANPRCVSHWTLDHTGAAALYPGSCCCQGNHRGSGMTNTCITFVCFTLCKDPTPLVKPNYHQNIAQYHR